MPLLSIRRALQVIPNIIDAIGDPFQPGDPCGNFIDNESVSGSKVAEALL
jgi:hypothetical protein